MPRVVEGSAQPGPASLGQASILKAPTTPRAHSKHVRFDVPMDTEVEREVTTTELKRNAAIQSKARLRHRRCSPGRIDPDYIALHNASLALESPVSTEPESKKRPAPGLAFSRAKRLQLLASSYASNPNDSLSENSTSTGRLDFKGSGDLFSSAGKAFNLHSGNLSASVTPLMNDVTLEVEDSNLNSAPQNGHIAVADKQLEMGQSAVQPLASLPGQQSSAFRSVSNFATAMASSTLLSTPSASGPNFVRTLSPGIRRHSWRQVRAAVANKQIPFTGVHQPTMSSGNHAPMVSPMASISQQLQYESELQSVPKPVPIQAPMPSFYSAVSNSDDRNHRTSHKWRQLRHAVTNRFTPMYRQMTQQQSDANNVYPTKSQDQHSSHNRVFPGGTPAGATMPSLRQAFPPELYAATAGGEVVDADDDNGDESGSSMSDCAPGPSTIGAIEFGRTSGHYKRPAATVGGVQTKTTPSSPSGKARGTFYARQVASTETQTDPVIVERSDACVQTDFSIPLYPFASVKQTSSAETQTDTFICMRVHPDMVSTMTVTEDFINCDNNNLSTCATSPRNPVANIFSRINKTLRWKQS